MGAIQRQLAKLKDHAMNGEYEANLLQEATNEWKSLGDDTRLCRDRDYPEYDEPVLIHEDFYDETGYITAHDKWERSEPDRDGNINWPDEMDEWRDEEPMDHDEAFYSEEEFGRNQQEWEENEAHRTTLTDDANELDGLGSDVENLSYEIWDDFKDLLKAARASKPDLDNIESELLIPERTFPKLEIAAKELGSEGLGEHYYNKIKKHIFDIEQSLRGVRSELDDMNNQDLFRIGIGDFWSVHRLWRTIVSLLSDYGRGRAQGGKGRFPMGWGIAFRGEAEDDIDIAQVDRYFSGLRRVYDNLLVGFPSFSVTGREFRELTEFLESIDNEVGHGFARIIDRAKSIPDDEIDASDKRKIISLLESDKRKHIDKFVREIDQVMTAKPV